MHCAAGGHPQAVRHRVGRLVELVVVDAAHCFADPLDRARRGDREADIVQPLEALGRHMVCAIFVADHGDGGHLAEGRHATHVVGLTEHRVEPFDHSFADARRGTEPDRRAEHEDVGVENLGSQPCHTSGAERSPSGQHCITVVGEWRQPPGT